MQPGNARPVRGDLTKSGETRMMLHYLDRPGFDLDSIEAAVNYDQNPNWSAYFGEMIFGQVPLRAGMRILDVACGTGYPALELSQRLGLASRVYGIDIWKAALRRARQKCRGAGITNFALIVSDAQTMCFADEVFDLVVSNVGINNFDSPDTVFAECYRVARPGAVIAMTTNPRGHMAEFYEIFETTLRDLDLVECLPALEAHLAHRLSVDEISRKLCRAGFSAVRVIEDVFAWRFVDGTAFLNTFHIIYGFLQGWKELIPGDRRRECFAELERRLNGSAQARGEFRVTIPVRYIEASKPGS